MSDRNRQLIEGGGQGHAGQGIDPEFVVTTVDVLDERMASHDDAGCAVTFQTAHRPQPGLKRPWSASTRLFAYCVVSWSASGKSLVIAPAGPAASDRIGVNLWTQRDRVTWSSMDLAAAFDELAMVI